MQSQVTGLLDGASAAQEVCVFCEGRVLNTAIPSGRSPWNHSDSECHQRPRTNLFEVLSRVESGSALRRLGLTIRPSLGTGLSDPATYNTHRRGLMRLLFGDIMKNTISQFTQLEYMEVIMHDDDQYFTASWWKTQITAEIPSLSDILTVKIIKMGMYSTLTHITPYDCSLT